MGFMVFTQVLTDIYVFPLNSRFRSLRCTLELVYVPRCGTGTSWIVDRPERPGHGSRSRLRTRLSRRDFRDLGTCLRGDCKTKKKLNFMNLDLG